MKGDSVEAVIDVSGTSRTFTVEATRKGRTVDIRTSRGFTDVIEVAGKNDIRTSRFLTARIIALIEHKAEADDSQVQERFPSFAIDDDDGNPL